MLAEPANPFTCQRQTSEHGPERHLHRALNAAAAPLRPVAPAAPGRAVDGDGQTNGQELGDPCCQWSEGATPGRTADISLPGDAASMAADPGAGCIEEEDDGCSIAAVRPDIPAGLAGLVVGGLLLAGLRRRRR